MKRVLFLADMHGGHNVGLTPPNYWYPDNPEHNMYKAGQLQRKLWTFYAQSVDEFKPYDIVICTGDCVEGQGRRSGGAELISPDLNTQVEIASECILYAGGNTRRMVRGTSSHVTLEGLSIEDLVAERVGAEIVDLGWYDINGVRFKVRHKIGTSTIPHGRATPVMREMMWNVINAALEVEDDADVLVYGHAHYDLLIEAFDRTGLILPGLQGLGTRYGAQQCSGFIHFGIRVADVYPDRGMIWHKRILAGREQKPTIDIL